MVGLDLSLPLFDVTSSGPRLHTPAQVWAPLREGCSDPRLPFFLFFFFMKELRKSLGGGRFRGAEGDAAF